MKVLTDIEKLAILKCVSGAVAKKDRREYLKYVHVFTRENKDQVIEASNGHYLIRITLKDCEDVSFPQLISTASIKKALKVKTLSLLEQVNRDHLKYFDLDRIINYHTYSTTEMISIDGEYLSVVADSLSSLGKAFKVSIGIDITGLNKTGGIRLEKKINDNIEVIAIIMPRR